MKREQVWETCITILVPLVSVCCCLTLGLSWCN